MGRKIPVELATRSFPFKGEARAFFKAMLNRYQPGHRVSHEDGLDLVALLERHPEQSMKVGSGIDHFEVMKTAEGTNCFRVVRVDGTGTDFSYLTCVNGQRPSQKTEVSQALRQSVRFDLFEARDRFFADNTGADGLVACAVSGERISPKIAHMDHRPPMTFEVIVTTFLGNRGSSYDDVPLSAPEDEQTSPEITDAEFSDAFRTYHNRVAKLDIVKNTINLSQANRHRLKDGRISLGASLLIG